MAKATETGVATDTRRVGVYVRISQDRDGRREGVEDQHDRCVAEAERQGWHVVDVYEDNDISASKGLSRQHYKRLLADVESGRINAIMAKDWSRLTRTGREKEDIYDLAKRCDLDVFFLTGGGDIRSADGRFILDIHAANAQRESAKIGERVKDRFEQKRAKGDWLGGTRPFGWNVRRDVEGFDAETGVQKYGPGYLVVNAEEKKAVAQASRRVVKGESLGTIAAEWNEDPRLKPTGKSKDGKWSRTTVRQVLLRPRNAGWIEHNGDLVAPGSWKPLISDDLWRQVERVLAVEERVVRGRVVRKPRTTNARVHLLSGIALCGVCGAPMKSGKATNRDKTTRTVYRCGGTETVTVVVKGKETPVERPLKGHPNRNAEPIDEKVQEYVIARLLREDVADLLHPTDDDDEQVTLAEQAVNLRAQMDELVEAYRARGLTIDVFTSTMSLLQRDLEAVEDKRKPATAAYVLDGLTDAASEEELRAVWFGVDGNADQPGLPLTRQRAVIDLLFTVKVGASGRAGAKFDGASVVITQKKSLAGRAAEATAGKGVLSTRGLSLTPASR